jgi:type I restriction enzyme M protein
MAEGGNGVASASLAEFIWKNAEDLWGPFKHTDFGKIILPFTLLRRLECVLESTRDAVLKEYESLKKGRGDPDLILRQVSGYPFYNTSKYTLDTLGSNKTRQNLLDYIAKFSDNARVIFDQFDFTNTVIRMDKAERLYKISKNFAGIDLHPDAVPDRVMSNIYEHLIRRFGAEVNEGAEDFMTPRDVVHLATTLLLDPDDELFQSKKGLVRTIYDPTCGTGGFLSDALAHVDTFATRFKVPPALIPFGQELEPETHAVALAGMLLRRLPTEPLRDLSQNIKLGSTLSDDQFPGERFNYCLSNPPFGKKWELDQKAVEQEHNEKGMAGRFGPGLPRINDGSMLFLMHLASKLELPKNGGGRAAIVLSGSPLFNGGAGSGESEIRRWLLEQDLVDAIVSLPTEIFFRTGIGTYLWILSNRKPDNRKKKVQLIDATNLWVSIKNEGNKRRKISDEQIRQIADVYAAGETDEISRMLPYRAFGYRRIRVLRPLRMRIQISEETLAALKAEKSWSKLDSKNQAAWLTALKHHLGSTRSYDWIEEFVAQAYAADKATKKPVLDRPTAVFQKALIAALGVKDPAANPVKDNEGNLIPDTDLTDYENVALDEDLRDYLAREVLPHVPDAYLDDTYRDEHDKRIGAVGYEINFTRYFFQYIPPRNLKDIDAELNQVEKEIADILAEVTE